MRFLVDNALLPASTPLGTESTTTAAAQPMRGMVGMLQLFGNLEPLMPLLAFESVCRAGNGTAHDLGRINLARW